ncbi:MAG: hypothetical protein J7513_01385 [Solirubrobacteraceae bacterium]|nr:hypothetical protein [Solirubrobacteraceae bacterium]
MPRASPALRGRFTFLGSSLSVGVAAFIMLAALAHTGSDGELAAAAAVIGLSFVLAVVPGAIQLRAAAQSAAGAMQVQLPARFVALSAVGFAALSPALAKAVHAPTLAVVLLAPGYGAACVAAAQRGRAIGRDDHHAASVSMAVEAGARLAAGVALGRWLGATGLSAALLLGSLAAAVAGRSAGRPVPVAAAAMLSPALSVGLLMLLVNLDAFAAPRLLGAAAADAYAVAELPARGVFFALFAVSWLAVPTAVRATTTRALLTPLAGVAGLGAAAGLTLLLVRPLLPLALGDPAPAAGLLATLVAAMTVAATLATALAMAVARGMRAPWAPTLLATTGLAAAAAALEPAAEGLAGLVLIAAVAALLATAGGLLRTTPPAVAHPLPALR